MNPITITIDADGIVEACKHVLDQYMWTSIEDSLPPEDGWYLVTAENDFGEIREMVTWFTPANNATGAPAVWGNYSKSGLWKNLAWMELPEPYEEG